MNPGRSLLVLLLVMGLTLPAFAHPPGVEEKDQPAAHEVEGFREFVKRAVDRKDFDSVRAMYAESFTHQVADFLKAAGEGKPCPPTFRDALETQYVCDAVLKSAKTKRWEKVKKATAPKTKAKK